MSKERAAKIANSPNASKRGGQESGSGGHASHISASCYPSCDRRRGRRVRAQSDPLTASTMSPPEERGTLGDHIEFDHEESGRDTLGGPDSRPSPASQIGREQIAGSDGSGLEPGTETREGWPMPDQTDAPRHWPDPTIDG